MATAPEPLGESGMFRRAADEYERTLLSPDLVGLGPEFADRLRALLELCQVSCAGQWRCYRNDQEYLGEQCEPPTPRQFGDWLAQQVIREVIREVFPGLDRLTLDARVRERALRRLRSRRAASDEFGDHLELFAYGGADVMIAHFEGRVWPYDKGDVNAAFAVLRDLSIREQADWLVAVARLVVNSYRRRWRALKKAGCWAIPTSDPKWDAAEAPDEEEEETATDEYQDRHDSLRRVLDLLNDETREILQLSMVEKMTKIAEIKGWSLATAYRRLHKAKSSAISTAERVKARCEQGAPKAPPPCGGGAIEPREDSVGGQA